MKLFYKIAALAATVLSLGSCEEFQPVFTGKYDDPAKVEPVVIPESEITPIADLIRIYVEASSDPDKPTIEKGVTIQDDIIIAGQVSTNDKAGNFYKSLYIQDETAGIEVKIGRNGLYNDYRPGQTVYVKCKDLVVGQYGFKNKIEYPDGNGCGGFSIGYVSNDIKYQNSYLESAKLIEEHVLRGPLGDPVTPVPLTEADLPKPFDTPVKNKNLGRLVTLKGLRYADQIFTFFDADNKETRVYLRDKSWGITTLSMSKLKMEEYLLNGNFDEAKYGGQTLGDSKGENGDYPGILRSACQVSQYFTMGSSSVQIRTSGYSKFGDREIDPAVLSGSKTVDVTGILALFEGRVQFTLIDEDGFSGLAELEDAKSEN